MTTALPRPGFAGELSPTEIRAAGPGYSVTIGQCTFHCPRDTYILDAAEEAGMHLPYACRSGSCSTCAGKTSASGVDNSDQSFLTDDQVREGFVLLCCAYALDDIYIEPNVQEQLKK